LDFHLRQAIERACRADILGVAERLGARLTKTGRWWIGPCPLGCAKDDGFVINPGMQVFTCRPSWAKGDVITLAQHILCGSFVETLEFINGSGIRQAAAPVEPTKAVGEAKKKKEAFVRRTIATIVRELVPVRRSPGERSLCETRGIDTDAIADVLERTDAIGWHPAVYFNQPGHPLHGRRLGCIVGIMSDPLTAQPTGAISRTYLDGDLKKIGRAKTLKTDAMAVGIVRLSPDEDVLEGLYIAEGLETALAAMAFRFRPIWSTGSGTIMAKFPVLSGIEALTIIADNDENGTGERDARKAAACWVQAGRKVRIIRPKIIGEDLSDVVRRRVGHEPKPD
jgi:hypothetical protein